VRVTKEGEVDQPLRNSGKKGVARFGGGGKKGTLSGECGKRPHLSFPE